jgi:hypothetical protein
MIILNIPKTEILLGLANLSFTSNKIDYWLLQFAGRVWDIGIYMYKLICSLHIVAENSFQNYQFVSAFLMLGYC